jgi:hypothetical protein
MSYNKYLSKIASSSSKRKYLFLSPRVSCKGLAGFIGTCFPNPATFDNLHLERSLLLVKIKQTRCMFTGLMSGDVNQGKPVIAGERMKQMPLRQLLFAMLYRKIMTKLLYSKDHLLEKALLNFSLQRFHFLF